MKWPEADNTPLDIEIPQGSGRAGEPSPLTWEVYDGGVMRVGRAIIIPAILALSVAGSVVTGAEVAVAAVHAPAVHVHTVPPLTNLTYYHG